MNTIEVNASLFDKAVRYADKAAGDNDRPALAHLEFTIKGNELSIVGCDGFRIHRAVVPFEGEAQDGQLLYHKQDAMGGIRQYKKDVGLRKRDTVELALGENGTLTATNCRTSVEWGAENWGKHKSSKRVQNTHQNRYGRNWHHETEVEIRRPNYPDWHQIWPQEGTTIEADKGELVAILKGIIGKAKEEARSRYWNAYCTVTTGSGTMIFNRLSNDGAVGDEIGSMSIEGEVVTFGVNAKYLLEALYGVEGDRVSVRVQDNPTHPLVVGDVAVIMPVHIGRGR